MPSYLIIWRSSCLHGLGWVPSFRICQSPFWIFLFLLSSQLVYCEFAYGITLYTHPSTSESLGLLSLMRENPPYKGVYGSLSYFNVLYGHISSLLSTCSIDIVNLNSSSPNLFHQKTSPYFPFASASLTYHIHPSGTPASTIFRIYIRI